MNEKRAVVALSLAKGISTKTFRSLIEFYGSSEAAFKAKPELHQLADLAAKEMDEAEKHGIQIIPITSPFYPESIKSLADAPLVLYVKGTLPKTADQRIGIVGTRAATEWGKDCARAFAEKLSNQGVWIISGLARGIDTEAHKGAINRTVAFIGSGLLHLYPKENEKLAEKIAESGAIVSEFALHTPPTRFSFPKRNRLIAAFSSALLLIEAPIKSGAMITMEIGLKQKKRIFALPGRAMNDNYQGNHLLIKERKAELVESPDELAKLLGIEIREAMTKKMCTPTILGEEQKILDLLYQSELSLDELSHFTCLPIQNLQVTLTKLILKSLAVELPGKRYKGINTHGKVINNR